MVIFPIEKLKFDFAELKGSDKNVSIKINIEPFELSLNEYSETVDTSLRLDSVEIPIKLKELEGKEFTFPINPNDGYIDGSIYFFGAHSPVDVTKIIFGEISNKRLPISLETTWLLEFEATGYENINKTVATNIAL